jgi:GalNAc-alpha-(1->4)-GalNAc-alpha-(1->3)-diNAcBac-PP-undecaprenol alpha-1,4-N-acetyl-D-galactosaminyltransferase
MGQGTFEAKFIPLSLNDSVEKIYVLRDKVGPKIDKLEYLVLPNYINRLKPLKILIPFLLAKYAKRYKCSFIIGYHIVPHAFFAFFASLISGIPFACAQTGIYIQRKSKNIIFGAFVKWVFRKVLFINVPGQMSKDYWIKFGVDPNKINILHSTIDTNRFSYNNSEKEFDFIILSRLSEEKRIEHLLKIFYELKNEGYRFTVCIAGDGPRSEYLKGLTEELAIGDIVSFVGFVDNTEEWFNKSKIFLLSSQSEGFPTALMQAMACELICVSTNVGNISDTIVNGENGFLVSYGDWKTYKEKLVDLLSNYGTDKMQIISKQARISIEQKHSHQFAVREWCYVFDKYFAVCS